MSDRGRARATVSIPTDIIRGEGEPPDNNNEGQATDTEADPGQTQPREIGVAPKDYNIHESVLYSHGYYEKMKTEDGTFVAKCLMCWERSKDKVVTRKIGDSSTKGLINHLQSYHKQYAKKWEEQKNANDVLRNQYNPVRKRNKLNDDGTKQPKLVGSNQGMLQVESNHDAGTQKRFDEARVLFCALTMTPFHAMKHDHLFVKALCPKTQHRIKIKGPNTISRHTGKMADSVRKDVFSLIKTAKKTNRSFAFSSDMSKTRSNASLISLTVHFRTPDNQVFKLSAYADYFGPRRHTGQNIVFCLRAFMVELGLDGPDIERYILLDNASNNVRAMALGTDMFQVVWCVIHTLQLSIKDSFKVKLGQVSVGKVLDKCHDVSTLVRRSEPNKDALKNACRATETPFTLPRKPIEIRWNAINDNVVSVIRIKDPLQLLSSKDTAETWSEVVPSQREFEVAKAVTKCLGPLKIATKTWESDKKSTLHEVVKQLWNIKSALEEESRSSRYVKMFARNLRKNIEKRFKNCGTQNKLFTMAHWFDPDMRGIILKEFRGVYERTLQDVKTLCLKYNIEPVAVAAAQPEEPEANDQIESNRTLTGAEKLKRRRREMSGDGDTHRSNPTSAANKIDLEICNYETNINDEDDFSEPLDWWYRNRSTYPILYQAAGEILSIPASSASSERAFSVATRACTSDRPQLSPQRISDLMMINLNLDSVQQYKEKYGITETYEGDLLSLVTVAFPDEPEDVGDEEVAPPVYDVGHDVEDEFEEEAVDDDYVTTWEDAINGSEDEDSDNEEEEDE